MDDAAADVAKRLFIPTFSLLLDGHVASTAFCPTVLPRSSLGLTSVSRKQYKRRPACTRESREIISAKINSSKYPPPVAFWAHGQLEFSPQAQLVPDQSNIYPRLFTSVLIKLISASDGHVFMARY